MTGSQGGGEETGIFRDVKYVTRPGIEPGSQDLASCALTARPPQHDTTGTRHRAFDVVQGSCYNYRDRKFVGNTSMSCEYESL